MLGSGKIFNQTPLFHIDWHVSKHKQMGVKCNRNLSLSLKMTWQAFFEYPPIVDAWSSAWFQPTSKKWNEPGHGKSGKGGWAPMVFQFDQVKKFSFGIDPFMGICRNAQTIDFRCRDFLQKTGTVCRAVALGPANTMHTTRCFHKPMALSPTCAVSYPIPRPP